MTTLDRRSLLALGGGALIAGAVGVSGCTGPSSGPGRATSSGSASPQPPVLEDAPLPRLRPRLVDGVDGRPITTAQSAAVDGDIAVLAGDVRNDRGSHLAVVRISDGTALWTEKELEKPLENKISGASVFGIDTTIAGTGSRALVPFQYYRSPCPNDASLCSRSATSATAERGVAAARLSDGSLLWNAVVLPSVPNDDPDSERKSRWSLGIADADAEHVLVNHGAADAVLNQTAAKRGDSYTVSLLEATTGRRRWSRDGVLGNHLAGSAVLASRPGLSTSSGSTLVLLDADTGRDLWTSGTARGRWLAWSESMAAVALSTSRSAFGAVQLIDPRTGQLLAELGERVAQLVIGTGADGRALAVWTTSNDYRRLYSLPLGETKPRANREPLEESFNVIGARVAGGYTWLTLGGADAVQPVDRTGAAAADRLSGRLLALTPSWAVLSLSDPSDTGHGIAVYALG